MKTYIRIAQTALTNAGYSTNGIDGVFGKDSLDALQLLIANAKTAVDILDGPGTAFNPNALLIPVSTNPPRASKEDIATAAKELGVEPALIKAINDVESPKGGFNNDGTPKILFERHKMWQGLTKINWFTKRNELSKAYPDVCHDDAGAYNERGQYAKLKIAANLNWEVAHESASWGFGQVMGFNWKDLGYDSIRHFVECMYKSEGEQLIAVCRYIKVNNLIDELQRHDWAGFAREYNGSKYKINKYDTKLKAAYIKAKKEGW